MTGESLKKLREEIDISLEAMADCIVSEYELEYQYSRYIIMQL